MSLQVLSSAYSTLELQAVTEVDALYFPVTYFGVVHSIRIGIALKQILTRNGSVNQISAGQVAFVTCVMIFGGGILASILLNQIPFFLTNPKDLFVYSIGALVMTHTPLGDLALKIPEIPLETTFALLDGFARAWGVTSLGVDNTVAHPTKEVSHSAFAVIFISTLIGAGGDLLVPLFNGFSHQWALQTPSYLIGSPSFDIWSCTLTSVLYAILIDNPSSIRQTLQISDSSGWITKQNVLKPVEAKAICAAFLMVAVVFQRIILANVDMPVLTQKQNLVATKQSGRVRWNSRKRVDPGNKKKTQ